MNHLRHQKYEKKQLKYNFKITILTLGMTSMIG